MTCRELEAKVADYLMGSIEPGVREAVEAHAAECPTCREEIASLAGIWDLMGGIPAPSPRPESEARFEAMLEAYRSGREAGTGALHAGPQPSAPRARRRLWLRAAAALLLLSVGVAAGFMMSSGTGSGGGRDHGPRFVLLVYEPADMVERVGPEEMSLLNREYHVWWKELEDSRRMLGWMHLAPEEGRLVVEGEGITDLLPLPPARSGERLAWVLVVEAAGLEEAAVIARGCPTLRAGARVEVRPEWRRSG